MKLDFEMADFKCLFLKTTVRRKSMIESHGQFPHFLTFCLTCDSVSLICIQGLLKYILVQLGIAAVHGPSVFACPFQSLHTSVYFPLVVQVFFFGGWNSLFCSVCLKALGLLLPLCTLRVSPQHSEQAFCVPFLIWMCDLPGIISFYQVILQISGSVLSIL